MGEYIKSCIEKKHLVEVDSKKDTHKKHDLTKVVPALINKPIFDYTAYPVVVDNVCTHLIVLCNRKKDEKLRLSEVKQSNLSFDEHKQVNFVLHTLQSVLYRISKNE